MTLMSGREHLGAGRGGTLWSAGLLHHRLPPTTEILLGFDRATPLALSRGRGLWYLLGQPLTRTLSSSRFLNWLDDILFLQCITVQKEHTERVNKDCTAIYCLQCYCMMFHSHVIWTRRNEIEVLLLADKDWPPLERVRVNLEGDRLRNRGSTRTHTHAL